MVLGMRDSWGVVQASSNHKRVSVGLKSSGAKFVVPFLSFLYLSADKLPLETGKKSGIGCKC